MQPKRPQIHQCMSITEFGVWRPLFGRVCTNTLAQKPTPPPPTPLHTRLLLENLSESLREIAIIFLRQRLLPPTLCVDAQCPFCDSPFRMCTQVDDCSLFLRYASEMHKKCPARVTCEWIGHEYARALALFCGSFEFLYRERRRHCFVPCDNSCMA